ASLGSSHPSLKPHPTPRPGQQYDQPAPPPLPSHREAPSQPTSNPPILHRTTRPTTTATTRPSRATLQTNLVNPRPPPTIPLLQRHHHHRHNPPSQSTTQQDDQPLTPTQLSHLLRLSALPLPTTATETTEMLATLHAQLHFVRDMQRVNTDGVAPLAAIRDETAAGQREATIGVATVRAALEEEEVYGRCRRPRRRRGAQKKEEGGIEGVEDWDVLGGAGEKVGRYFVVRSGKGDAIAGDAVVEEREVKEGE
ncbi:hypothetical protein B0I37DRAFT_163645, partial [Chaetomium sp. MPI-CAGE-AT-0009]